MTRRNFLIAILGVGATCALAALVPPANGKSANDASFVAMPPLAALVRDGAVLTGVDDVDGCARHDLPVPGRGGVVVGLAACDPGSAGGGSVQLERVFEEPYQPTILTIRIAPPTGVAHSIESLRRDGRARIRLDGRVIWEARAASDAGGGRYFAIAEPAVLTTVVVRGRARHALRFEVDPSVLWNIAKIEIRSDAAPRSIKGIAYSPYRDCQLPGGAQQPTADEIGDDMARLIHSSTAVRTYSALGVNARAVAVAGELGHPVYAGAWLDDVPGDRAELDALTELARTRRPAGYIVGNEFYLRHQRQGRHAVEYLLAQIRRFETSLPARHAPVMTAEVDGMMFQWACEGNRFEVVGIAPDYQPILDATDAIMVHIYPFWNGQPIEGAAWQTAARYVAIREFVQRRYPGKQVILGETGWPSAGARQGAAVPGRDAQRRYMAEFMQLADEWAIDYFYFDAFDERWKMEEPGHVGQHWGYADATRAAKYDISGALLPRVLLASTVGPATMAPVVCGARTGPMSSAASPATVQVALPDQEVVYSDWLNDESKFVPGGWMGDTQQIGLFACDRSAPHGGDMAIRAQFSPDGPLGWAGVAWQAKRVPGADLQPFDWLNFWVRGSRGGEVVEFRVGGAAGDKNGPGDTLRPGRSSGPLVLSGDWQPVTIALGSGDRSRVVTGFSWIASRCQNSQPITFFLDDIRFEAQRPEVPIPSLAHAPFYVYDDAGSGCSHFVPSGLMGDIGDVALDPSSTENPFRGHTAIQVRYHPSGRGDGWAGMYWQNPERNWGKQEGGFDLSWAGVLTFHARGRNGGEVVEFVAGGMGKMGDRHRDTMPIRTTGPVRLAKGWHRYAIELRGTDRTRVAGGFAFSISASNNPHGAEFFLDEIAYEAR